jgi:Ca2+-binding EF-hand superfamily protein
MRSPERMFDRIDANHDGSISRSEFVDARHRMMERRQERRAGGGPAGDRRP